jgi:hypothetical protein
MVVLGFHSGVSLSVWQGDEVVSYCGDELGSGDGHDEVDV